VAFLTHIKSPDRRQLCPQPAELADRTGRPLPFHALQAHDLVPLIVDEISPHFDIGGAGHGLFDSHADAAQPLGSHQNADLIEKPGAAMKFELMTLTLVTHLFCLSFRHIG
jgi:hypothetical protein